MQLINVDGDEMARRLAGARTETVTIAGVTLRIVYDRDAVYGSEIVSVDEDCDVAAVMDFFNDKQLVVSVSEFRAQVWRALLTVPMGSTVSYSSLAEKAGRPDAVRAAATAVASNAIAPAIPCHRVVRADGRPGNYRWGTAMKCRLLASEQAGCYLF